MNMDRDGRGLSVLVVEDDPSLLAAMVECLMRSGFRVSTAHRGAEALEADRRTALDAYVIDVFLPDAGGLGVARALCRQRARAALPVLFVTALSVPSVRLALAPAAVLFKPFTRRQLLDALLEVLRRPPPGLGHAGLPPGADLGEGV